MIDDDVCKGCGRRTAGEFCQVCGAPLCSMCYECGAGFCDECRAMMLGGHHALASVMGPDEDMAEHVSEPVTVTLCQHCAVDPVVIAFLAGKEER